MFEWSSFIIFILASFGLTNILVNSKLLDSIRPKHYFFHCTMCIGFWVGILMYIGLWMIDNSDFIHNIEELRFWARAFVMGCISSGTSYALSGIFSDEGINVKHS